MLMQENPQLASKRRLAQMMMQQGAGGGDGGQYSGTAAMLQALLGAYMEKKAGEQQKTERGAASDALAKAVSDASSLKSEKGIQYSPDDFKGPAFDQAAVAAAPEASGNQKRAALIDTLSRSPNESVRGVGGKLGLQMAMADPVQDEFINMYHPESLERVRVPKRQQATRASAGFLEGNLPDVLDPKVYEARKKLAAESRSQTSVNLPSQENSYNKKVGELDAEAEAEIYANERTARTSVAKYGQLGQMLSGIKTGAFKGTTTQLKAAAKSAGLDLESWGVTDDLAPAQAAQALTNGLALEMRNPAGGAGMPGALSDADREYLKAMIAGIDKDPDANATLIDMAVRLNQRSIEVARLARTWKKEHGGGRFQQSGFTDFLDQWSAQNPLFTPPQNQTPPPAAGPAVAGGVDYLGLYGLNPGK